tara:strand:- start:412 stop:801 length:390 start_codon:yes stop_codon:yes gene_type:complete
VSLVVVSFEDNMRGVITTTDIKKGNLVYQFKKLAYLKDPTRTSIQVGPAQHIEDVIGRYVNHNCNPNIKVIRDNRNIKLVAIQNILKTQEITFDYNSTEWKLTYPFRCNCHGTLITGRYYKEVQNGETS